VEHVKQSSVDNHHQKQSSLVIFVLTYLVLSSKHDSAAPLNDAQGYPNKITFCNVVIQVAFCANAKVS